MVLVPDEDLIAVFGQQDVRKFDLHFSSEFLCLLFQLQPF